MPFYTPRGLRIRLDVPSSFTLMARLYPARGPVDILTTVEGLEAVPSLLWQLLAVIALVSGAPPLAVIVIAVAATILSELALRQGFLLARSGPASIGFLWSRIPMLLRLGGELVVAYLVRGWLGVGTWGAAFLSSFVIGLAMEFFLIKRQFRRGGIPYTRSEMLFLRAYQLHASMLIGTSKIDVTDDEVQSEQWIGLARGYLDSHPGRVLEDDDRTPDVSLAGMDRL